MSEAEQRSAGAIATANVDALIGLLGRPEAKLAVADASCFRPRFCRPCLLLTPNQLDSQH